MAPLARRFGALLCALVTVLACPLGSAAEASPITKVVELLKVLQRQLEEDGRADGKQYKEYDKWFQNSYAEAKKVITQTTNKLAELKSGLEEQDAFREKASQQFEKVSNSLASLENDYKGAKDRREKERKTFQSNEADFMRGVDQLERTVTVLKKKMPKAAAALLDENLSLDPLLAADALTAPEAPKSLLEVAKNLRATLENSKDFALSPSQKDSVEHFFRLAAEGERVPTQALDFLQISKDDLAVASDAMAPYGDYESQSGGILSTMQSVMGKMRKQLIDAQNAEAAAAKEYKKLIAEMEKEMKSKEKAISEIRTQTAQSQEKTGQMKAQLLAAQELLKVTQDQKKTIEEENVVKSRNYKERTARRTDEHMAVKEALTILTSDDMKKLMAQQSIGTDKKGSALTQTQEAAVSFVQLAEVRQHLHGLAASPEGKEILAQLDGEPEAPAGLSLLSLRSRTHLHTRNEPFGKIKSLVRSMLKKLSDEQAKDEKHSAWCDSELAKSTASKESKEKDVQKLKDRIEEMDAEIAQLTDDLKSITADVAEMKKTTAEATKVRTGEAERTKVALAQYRDAQKLLNSAIKVLARVYHDKVESQGNAGNQRNGMGGGVVGILEIALDDYAKLEKELVIVEGVAQKDYKKLMDESEVRMAVFSKDLEYKGRSKTKLNGDRMRASTDLKSEQKELAAVLSYLKELQAACTIKPDSYAERKARREAALKGLKEALTYLKGN